MESSGYQSERTVAWLNALANQSAAYNARIKARKSRNADVLREMAASDGFELETVYRTVEAVFSTVPKASVAKGLTRKLEAIGGNAPKLAGACEPLTRQTVHKWLKRDALGVTELCICILGLCRLSGDSVASCAGSVAALCSRETLEGGEDALREALIERVMTFVEFRLREADTSTLKAIAALMCTEQVEQLWRLVKTDE